MLYNHNCPRIHILNTTIASLIGEAEAIVLNQIQYWLSKCGRNILGYSGKWIYNSLKSWEEQFSYMSTYKIRKAIKTLEKLGLVISIKINAKKWNHTKWYSIDQDKYNSLVGNKKSSPEGVLENTGRNNALGADITHGKKTCKNSTNRYVENQQIITNNSYTNKNSSYKEQNLSRVIKPAKEEVLKKEILLAEKMKETWNIVFQCSPKPIKAYLNKSLIPKLCKLYQEKFSGSIQEWELYAKKINSSKFLMGEKDTKNNFKAVFLWLIKEETVDAILGGAYGVGDRTLDLDNLDHNLKIQETEVTTIANEKVSQYLDQMVDEAKEENEFKEYVLKMKYHDDTDRYRVKKHMEEVGKHYMYGGYITPSHVYYPDKVAYRKRLYKSYLMAKYLGIDEISLDKEIKRILRAETNKIKLFRTMTSIKERITNISFTGRDNKFDISAITVSGHELVSTAAI